MTTNVWIDHVLKDIPEFMGVRSIDNMMQPKITPAYTIINFAKSTMPGSHFICVIFVTKQICLYFDSLNLPDIPFKIEQYMHLYSDHVYRFNFAIQSVFSGFCGIFALLPIMLHVNNFSILQIFECMIFHFEEGSLRNDRICVDLLVYLFKLYYTNNHHIPFTK